MLQLSTFFIVLAFLMLRPLFGDELLIDATKLFIDKQQKIVAKDKVKVTYKGVDLFSTHIEYDEKESQLLFLEPTEIKKDGQSIFVKEMALNLDKQEGVFKDVSSSWEGLHWKIKEVRYKPNHIHLIDSYFSTCSPTKKQVFAIKCFNLQYNKEENYISSKNNRLSVLGNHIPLFDYRKKTDLSESNLDYYIKPKVSFDKLEGGSFGVGVPVYSGKKGGGSLFAGLTTKQGFKLGVNNEFYLTQKQTFFSQFGMYTSAQPSYLFRYLFEQNLNNEIETSIFDIMFSQQKLKKRRSSFSLYLDYYQRQYLNFEVVSARPNLGFQISNMALPMMFRLNQHSSFGKFYERGFNSNRLSFETNINRIFHVSPDFELETELENKLSFYSQDVYWKQYYLNFYLRPELRHADLEFSLKKSLWDTEGESPFKFDSNKSKQNDELGMKLKFPYKALNLGFEWHYDLEKARIRDTTYFLGVDVFCNLVVRFSWSPKWDNFSFDIGLKAF